MYLTELTLKMVDKIEKYNNYLIPLFLLIFGLYAVPISIFGSDLKYIMGDLGDARFNNYILEHGYKYLIGDVENFWDVPMMFPFKNVIAFSDNLLGTLPVYAIYRFSGFDRETAFQLWIISMFALNYIFCFWALKKWTGNIIISATAAYIFAFGIYNIGHFEHVQVFPKFIASFVIFWFWKFLSETKLKYFLFASLGLVYQYYCGIYLGFFLLYTLFFLFAAYLIIYRDNLFFKKFLKVKFSLVFVSIIFISSFILFFLIKPYLDITTTTNLRNFQEIATTVPKPVSYFFTHIAAKNWYDLSQHSQYKFENWWMHFHFSGIIPWLGIIVGILVIWRKKVTAENKKIYKFIYISLILNIMFCINIKGFSLYKFVMYFPGFSSMRSIDRILNIQIILFLIIFALSFSEIYRLNKKIKLILMLFPFFAIFDNAINVNVLKRFDKKFSQNKVNDIVINIKEQYDKKYKAIAYLPQITKPTEPDVHIKTIELQLSVILAAQSLNIPVVNSYTGYYPVDYGPFFSNMDTASLRRWCIFMNYNYNDIQQINDLKKSILRIDTIYLKSMFKNYISCDLAINNLIFANKDKALEWETFRLLTLKSGKSILISCVNNFVASIDKGKSGFISETDVYSDAEEFSIYKISDNYVALQTANGHYLGIDTNSMQVFAKSISVGKTETFEVVKFKKE